MRDTSFLNCNTLSLVIGPLTSNTENLSYEAAQISMIRDLVDQRSHRSDLRDQKYEIKRSERLIDKHNGRLA